jgi:uncharacterized protein YhbP (UPF0306 family)
MTGCLGRLFGVRQPMDAAVPRPIIDLLDSHHVVALAVADDVGPWVANCFYAFDAGAMALIVLTSTRTRHGRALLASRRLAGAVAGQPEAIADIRGVQFEATAERLAGGRRAAALCRFARRHPQAALLPTDIWALRLDSVKYTDNCIVFARKLHWARATEGGSAS